MKQTKRKEIKHRDISIVALIGKSRVFADRKRQRKLDVTNRKAKHKKQDRED